MDRHDAKGSQTTRVTVFGSELSVVSDESPEYTHRVSTFVDQRMSEIASELNLADPTKVAIMTALDIADRLLRRRTCRDNGRARAGEAVQRLGRCLDRAGIDEVLPVDP